MATSRNLPSFLETEDQQKIRFQIELEFVQCLANPNYLNFLAQRGIFKETAFVSYLKYLTYWKEPEYAKYLKYPQCLMMLDLVQSEHFRKELMNAQCARFIDDQQLLHWQHYQRKRMRLVNEQAERAASAGSVLQSSAAASTASRAGQQGQSQQALK